MNIEFLITVIATIFSFFVIGAVLGAAFSPKIRTAIVEVFAKISRRDLMLAKLVCNPVIEPGTHPWSAAAVLNPAAVVLNGRTHLIYRAVGMDGVSRLGYASSKNGIVFDDLLPYPVYSAENQQSLLPAHKRHYSPVLYPSGGSWGGCEDPRMVTIEGRVYVTFNMFEDWSLRVGMISLSEEDFLAKRFDKWDGPYIISHGSRDKNWVLFPEKIGGKFAVLHSIIGDTDDEVRIEYTDDVRQLSTQKFESPDPQKVPDRDIAWHRHVRSAGPPPVKTKEGWLVFYHAHDADEGDKYKLGAMLLDLHEPSKILYRSPHPILLPDESYENNGKPGIVYACGAVVRDGLLYIYYGGADKVVCVAFAPIEAFVKALTRGGHAAFTSQETKTR